MEFAQRIKNFIGFELHMYFFGRSHTLCLWPEMQLTAAMDAASAADDPAVPTWGELGKVTCGFLALKVSAACMHATWIFWGRVVKILLGLLHNEIGLAPAPRK